MNDDLGRITRLSLISDHDADDLVSPGTWAELSERVMTAGERPAPWTGRGVARRPGWLGSGPRRRWLIGVPVAAALAAAILIATSIGRPGERIGPVQVGPAKAAALVFTRHGRYIDVIVRDPFADPAKYRAEFRAHGLDVTLKLVPASPSLVGTVVYFGGTKTGAVKTITKRGRCFTGGAGLQCPIGLRVPVHFSGQADLVFGRPARPGERYETTAGATVKGEVLHGLHIVGRHVTRVIAMAARRQVTVPFIHLVTADGTGRLVPAGKVPGSWFVYGADPWAPGQVTLWAGKTRKQPVAGTPSPGAPTPTATASPAPAR